MSVHRYQQLAAALTVRIESGVYAVGTLLPTEQDLCAEFAVSRHTVREALRCLHDAGLIERKQGSGSRVTHPQLSEQVGSLQELLQYGASTRLDLIEIGVQKASAEVATQLEIGCGDSVLRLVGIRRRLQRDEALCYTEILRAAATALPGYSALDTALTALLTEIEEGNLSTVEQRLSAVPMPEVAADQLFVDRDSPALLAVRRYRDRDGQPLILASSWHPGEWFSYASVLQRKAVRTD